MKKIIVFIGIGAMALAFMSSTCSSSKDGSANASKKMTAATPAPGISFRNMSYQEALEEAKASGKLIFIDAYTDWCGPCKYMAKTSFKDEQVGELYNKNFINLKVEMEKSKDGPELARRFRVVAYPTLLVVDGNGRLVKQITGMRDRDQLIAFAKSVL